MRVDKKKVRLAMARACMTPDDLAKKAQMPSNTVWRLLKGHNVRIITLGRAAKALDVDPSEILADEG